MAVKEGSNQFLNPLTLAAPAPFAIALAFWNGGTRPPIPSCSPVVSSLFKAAPCAIYRRKPQPNLKCAVSEATRGEGREERSDRVDLGRDSPLLFSPQQEATDADRADEVQDTRGVYSEPSCNRREQHNRNRCRSAGKRRRRRARSVTGHQA